MANKLFIYKRNARFRNEIKVPCLFISTVAAFHIVASSWMYLYIYMDGWMDGWINQSVSQSVMILFTCL
jgi:hypothetical protein